MTDRHIPVDSDLNYFTVTCHLAPIVADLSQDSDYDPNTARIDCIVTFTPKYKTGEVIHSHTSTPPTGFLALPVTAMIDDGYLKLRAKADLGAAPLPGTLHGLKAKIAKDTGKEPPVTADVRALNYAPVRLLGNSASLEIDPEIPLYYDFSFSNIKIDGKQTNIQITGGTFEAPWDDELIDLLDYMPLTPGPFAGPMVVGPQGPQGEPGPATIDVGSTTTSAPGTDASVSNGGDTVNAVLDFVIPRGDVGPPGPAGGLLEFDSAAVFPAAGEAGYAYLAKDTGDTYRFNTLAKTPGYVRISERVKSTGIEDSTAVGRAVVVAADAAAARTAIGAETAAQKGAPDGYAPLVGSKVPAANLPSYVDDIVEAANLAAFPATGETGKIYVALDSGMTYRWSGTTYVAVSDKVLSTGITDSTAVGRAVIVAVDERAARVATLSVGKVAPATGAVADAAVLAAALALDAVVRVEDGTYVVPAAGVTVPAGKSLLVGEGSTVKLADGQVGGAAGLYTAVRLGDGSTFIGAVDGNRAKQDKAAYNAGPGSANWLVMAEGTKAAPLSGLHIDAQITGAVNIPVRLDYVKDSYVRIRAKDCGGAVLFTNCDNLEVDIEVDGTDNQGWKIWQHAVDFTGCTRVRGRVVIRNQSGTGDPSNGTGLSSWNSGLTILDSTDITFDEIDCEFTTKPDQSKSLGISLLGVRRIHVSRLRCVGYEGAVELGGVVDGTFVGLEVDGRYTRGWNGQPGTGINIYNNAQRGDFKGRTLEHCRNLTFVGGSVRRTLGNGIVMKAASDIVLMGLEVSACLSGLYSTGVDQDASQGPAPSAGGAVGRRNRFIGCDFVYNERCGVDIFDGVDWTFDNCRFNNNAQSLTFGSTRFGQGLDAGASGLRTSTGTSKTGLVICGDSQADDLQGVTAWVFPDRARPTVVAVDRPERYGIGQTVTIVGAGVGGADLLTRVDDIRHDELTLQHPVESFPEATLTGTISTSGTTVTGEVGTAFLTQLTGRAWIKVGSEYKRIARVASDTSATLDEAFSANAPAGTALVIVRADATTAKAQRHGYTFSADTVDPVVTGRTPTGNVVAGIADSSTGGYRTLNKPVVNASMTVDGGAGTPNIQAKGTNANTSLTLFSQGLGSVWIMPGSGSGVDRIAQFNPLAGNNNYLQFTTAPGIAAQSTVNADVNLTLTPKNKGNVIIWAGAGQTPMLRGSGPDPAGHNLKIAGGTPGVVQIATTAGTLIGEVEVKGHKHVAADVTGAESTANKNAVSGYAGLDINSRILPAQLPLSAVEYKGVWSAATAYPTTPNTGDMWRVSTAGTQGGVTYAVGDVLFYDGTAWGKLGGNTPWVAKPATPTSPGTAGQIAYGLIGAVDHMFVCTAANVWKATPLSVTTWT